MTDYTVEPIEEVTWGKFLLFGDSITQMSCLPFGYNLLSALQHYYARKLDVVVRGFSGYNSDHAKLMIKPIFKQLHHKDGPVKGATIFFGSNDCADNETQNVPLDRYAENIKEIASFLKSQGVVVLIVGCATMDARTVERTAKSALKYNLAAKKVAQELGVGFVDLYSAFVRAAGGTPGFEDEIDYDQPENAGSFLLVDGLHFSPAGYRQFYLEIVKAIDFKFPEIAGVNLPTIFPEYDKIDPSNAYDSLFPAITDYKDSMAVGRDYM